MQEFSSDEPQKILNIISTLTDNTRLEILSLLIQNKDGLTAADISRQIDKKIPSTIYQLEIIQASGLIESKMKMVKSIGREIKHWILPEENYHFLFKVDLSVIINESTLTIEIRDKYLTYLRSIKSRDIRIEDLDKFDSNILSQIILSNGAKLDEKDITKICQLKAFQLLIDTYIYRCRNILSNINVNERIDRFFFTQMLGITEELMDRIVIEIPKYFDLGYDYQTNQIFRQE